MKELLIKLSRNSVVMIPIVGVLAISLFIGGYFIRHDQISRQHDEQTQTGPRRQANENFQPLETVDRQPDPITTEQATDSATDNQSNVSTGSERVDIVVSTEVQNDSLVITAAIDSNEPGHCVMSIHDNGEVIVREKVQASGGICQLKLTTPELSDQARLRVIFMARNFSLRATTNEQLVL